MSEKAEIAGLEESVSAYRASFARRGLSVVSAFEDKDQMISIDKLADGFGMSKAQLAETAGLKPDTIYRAARLNARPAQTRLREMLEILGRVAGWAGGPLQALSWYRAEPIPAFGGRTAESLVKDGKAATVRDYLDHVATGGFA
ncbi:antitoxin Xre/MbcA/ParS toxin-binding domain-containing protein [Oricola indica]|uniref:antitoxin Xre/MbcA/ParS toxin-binding domain-containing protein n=1 Tax=Oricola indica TaxID=2872591 RepID=UPI003CCBC8D5